MTDKMQSRISAHKIIHRFQKKESLALRPSQTSLLPEVWNSWLVLGVKPEVKVPFPCERQPAPTPIVTLLPQLKNVAVSRLEQLVIQCYRLL